MAGTDNTYGHPHDETIAALDAIGATIYGTDVHGTIVVTTDGVTYDVQPTNEVDPGDSGREGDGLNDNSTDTTPPLISGIIVSNITETTAMISWATDELSTGNIEYGQTTAYSSMGLTQLIRLLTELMSLLEPQRSIF